MTARIVSAVLSLLAVLTRAAERARKKARRLRRWGRRENRAAWRVAREYGDRRTCRRSWGDVVQFNRGIEVTSW